MTRFPATGLDMQSVSQGPKRIQKYLRHTVEALLLSLSMLGGVVGYTQTNNPTGARTILAQKKDIKGNTIINDTITKESVMNTFHSDLIKRHGKEKATMLITSFLVEELNKIRKEHGLSPLVIDPVLQKAAQEYAQYLIDNNHYSHIDKQGGNFDKRYKEAKIELSTRTSSQRRYPDQKSGGRSTDVLGEALAPTPAPSASLDGLLRSREHKKILMDSNATYIGVGYAGKSNEPYQGIDRTIIVTGR